MKEKRFEEILKEVAEKYLSEHNDVINYLDDRLSKVNDYDFAVYLHNMVMSWHQKLVKSATKPVMMDLCEYALMYIVYRDKSVPEGKSVLYENIKKMVELYKRKNHDYGSSFDDTMKICGLYAPFVRIFDKVNRIKTLLKPNSEILVEDEKVLDTFRDLVNYCVLTILYLEDDKDNL